MSAAILLVVLGMLTLSILGSLYRIIRGPSAADRIVALDLIGIHLIAATAVVSVYLKTFNFLNVILLVGILSFIGTISFSKFIERGVVIDRKRDR